MYIQRVVTFLDIIRYQFYRVGNIDTSRKSSVSCFVKTFYVWHVSNYISIIFLICYLLWEKRYVVNVQIWNTTLTSFSYSRNIDLIYLDPRSTHLSVYELQGQTDNLYCAGQINLFRCEEINSVQLFWRCNKQVWYSF